jgi:hypothetical protein
LLKLANMSCKLLNTIAMKACKLAQHMPVF